MGRDGRRPPAWLGSYQRWWLTALPPMSGPLRFVFYAGLFALALWHRKSPLLALSLFEATDPALYRPYGLIELIGIPYLDPDSLRIAVWVMAVGWVFAAIGLFTRTSATVAALIAFFLHGYFWASNAINHSWSLPVYALLCLCLMRSDDRWSVDFHLRKLWRRDPEARDATLGGTGFGRVAFLVVAVGFYFAAGTSKLSDSGLKWMDGLSLQFHLFDKDGPEFLAQSLWMCLVISVLTIVVEVGSIFALVSRWLRLVIVLGLTSFHIGIWVTVGPWYFANIWCLMLLIDWRDLWSRLRSRVPRPRPEFAVADSLANARTWLSVAAASALFPVLGYVALVGIEWWPVSNVPMFSSYNGPGYYMGVPEESFGDVEMAQALARGCLEEGCGPHVEKTLAYHVHLKLVSADPAYPPLDFRDRGLGVPTRTQWSKSIVQPVILRDLAEKPIGRIEFDPDAPPAPMTRLLEEVVPVIRRNLAVWRRFERAEFWYRLDDGEVLIASAPLSD